MTIAGKEITKKLVVKFAGFFAIGALVLGAVVYLGLIWNEKRQFAQAEKEIDALYAQIVEKVGKPDQEKKEKSCGYASRVYGRGPRACSVSIYVLYENKDIKQANELSIIVSQTMNVKPSRYELIESTIGEYKFDFAKEDTRVIDQSLSADLKLGLTKSCSIELVHPVVSSSYLDKFKDAPKENMLIGLTCGGPALAEYFPATKD